MNSRTEELLRKDSLLESEKILGKNHYSEFNKGEQGFALFKFILDNKIKEQHLKSVGDTYFNMSWNDFIALIEDYGFIEGLRYDFEAPKHGFIGETDKVEEAIIYYHPYKGLILWATSYDNKDHINDGKVYGMAQYSDNAWDIFNGCSHGDNGEKINIRHFDKDIREGLIHTLNKIEERATLLPKWEGSYKPFLWFVDYAESKKDNYDYKAITREKIRRCPKNMQDIIGLDEI